MSTLIFTHIVTGLTGIVAGLIAVGGIFLGKSLAWCNAIFLSTTAAACLTGFVFLPTGGVTSAQLVAFFLIALLATATYSRYARHLNGSWNQIYALTAVGSLFLNILITTAQSFLHIRLLKTVAPTQQSPIFVAIKITLLAMFIVVALTAARRADRS